MLIKDLLYSSLPAIIIKKNSYPFNAKNLKKFGRKNSSNKNIIQVKRETMVTELAAGKLVVKKSKFYAHLYQISSIQDTTKIIDDHQKKYSNANHHCYAIWYSDDAGSSQKEFQHDGEVGHPGKVLLQLLERHDLNSHALVVSRIFGGIKLGVGGVSRAFRKAGNGAINLYKN